MRQTCQLSPFLDDTAQIWSAFQLSGDIERTHTHLNLTFRLQGHLSDLVLPAITPSPTRMDNLWESTCFEFFFGEPQSSAYWEVNLCSSYNWNLYHFTNYRDGMAQEKRIQRLPCHRTLTRSEFSLSCQVSLEALDLAFKPLHLNVTSVLQRQAGDIGYWAVTHSPKEADFHHRPSFTIYI